MRYHLIPISMAKIKKDKKKQVLAKMWRKANLGVQLVGKLNFAYS